MKYKATVEDVNDPDTQGKIKVHIHSFDAAANTSPWVLPCTLFAGNGYGFYCLPQVGDEVFVEETADGDYVYTGFFWTGRNPKPSDGAASVRIFQTPIGHKLKFVEDGNIEIEHKEGATVILHSDGSIELNATVIKLNGDGGGVITTQSPCPFTSLPHTGGSTIVKADLV